SETGYFTSRCDLLREPVAEWAVWPRSDGCERARVHAFVRALPIGDVVADHEQQRGAGSRECHRNPLLAAPPVQDPLKRVVRGQPPARAEPEEGPIRWGPSCSFNNRLFCWRSSRLPIPVLWPFPGLKRRMGAGFAVGLVDDLRDRLGHPAIRDYGRVEK